MQFFKTNSFYLVIFSYPNTFINKYSLPCQLFLYNTAKESAPKEKGQETAKPKAADWSEQ